jgi:hypothetical protein
VVFAPLLGRIPPQILEAGTVTFSLARLPECRNAALTLDTDPILQRRTSGTNSTRVRVVPLLGGIHAYADVVTEISPGMSCFAVVWKFQDWPFGRTML